MMALMIMIQPHVAISFLARLMLVSYFLSAGLINIRQPKAILTQIQNKKIPLPHVALALVFFTQIVGSLLVIVNWHAAWGAFGLLVFTLASNILYCTFWSVEGFTQHLMRFLFSANIAVMGGLLLVITIT